MPSSEKKKYSTPNISVTPPPQVAIVDYARQREVLEDVAQLLTEVTVRHFGSLPLGALMTLKSAIRLLRGK